MNTLSDQSPALLILSVLRKHSDPSHLLTQEDIIAYLEEEYGFLLERKAVSRNIEKIRNAGYSIVRASKREDPGKRGGYYLDLSEELTEAQWKIILSAVSSAGFVSESEAKEMTEKIGRYVSEATLENLRSNTVVRSEKTQNPEVIDTISELGRAILGRFSIRFRYVDYYWKGIPHYHRTKEFRNVVPCATKWENDRFYLIGYLREDDILYPAGSKRTEERLFRVDKMENLLVDESRTYDLSRVDTEHFADQKIGLYAGEKRLVKCAVNEKGLGMVLDRFGERTNEVHVGKRKNDEIYPFEVSFTVEVSPVFFGWMTTLGDNAKILAPQSVIGAYLELSRTIARIYGE
ncbi:MAG: WYL domain-containing protein [Erysipelotrichales bacterium]|nr:WYL domain-containing protein [Erysipelotrichales bacterium]